MARITIDIVSDVVCPWCYLGKARLDLAIADVQDEIGIDVNWRPYRLNPDYPAEGVDHQTVLAEKLGGKAAMDEAHAKLAALGEEVGINFDFAAIKVGPNTLDAHRLIHWAGTESREHQDTVVSALFRANFEEGRNIGDRAVLLEIATAAGLDAALIGRLLDSDADADHVLAEIEAAQKMGVNGVPFFILDQQYAVSGAQPQQVLASAFRELAEEKSAAHNKLN
ncbi:DsbA family oxidoreductase [Rhizobium halophytocola]|uniref:DsbA family dithiol-disulfide isomerase n=1 Tax=Rhizobium halophytocola TaxID=735519 RepID=A0ABS4DWL8_9HYPH|nr:DsbA family oxidoreductase [Rhizobium halophytocola]MBP1850091.1 putative DsbA family dithiol-disulfide isomerase [Rhizobium halophytocola]